MSSHFTGHIAAMTIHWGIKCNSVLFHHHRSLVFEWWKRLSYVKLLIDVTSNEQDTRVQLKKHNYEVHQLKLQVFL